MFSVVITPPFRENFAFLVQNLATNLRARAKRASKRFATRRETAALFLMPLLALCLAFSRIRCSLFGRASSVFSQCFFKRMHPKKKEKKKEMGSCHGWAAVSHGQVSRLGICHAWAAVTLGQLRRKICNARCERR